ncbi:ATP-binding cassette domain-containing protein [archaeon]|nr:MAG: ATP-binding cassette domain-containing protein [archaeon]
MVQVRLENASVSIQVDRRAEAIPSVPVHVANILRSVVRWKRATQTLRVLQGITAEFKPGSSTLIIGSPGSGKSTLLRLIAGSTKPDDAASVMWNGETASALHQAGLSVRKLCTYAPQVDIHEPLLTVRETFDFLHSVSAYVPPHATEEQRAEIHSRVERTVSVLQLEDCVNTVIGNTQVRGVSGGERKRVTIGEVRWHAGDAGMLATRHAAHCARVCTTSPTTKPYDTISALNLLPWRVCTPLTNAGHAYRGARVGAG